MPIYALDPRVLPPQQSDTMAELAINTGGLHFIGQSNPLGAVDKIVADNGSFYTLGFYPEPLVTDGKYHEIKVNVKRDGVRVRSRERYLADTATPVASTPTRDMTKSLSAGLDDPSLPVRVTAVPLAAATRGFVRTLVTMEVTYPQTGQDLSFDDELRVGILPLSTDGKVKASFQRPIQFKGKFKPGAKGTFVMPALPAPLDVTAQSRGPAGLDGGHDPALVTAHVPCVGGAPVGAVVTEDIRHLQRGGHRRRSAGRHDLQAEPVERAGGAPDRAGRNLGIARGRRDVGMPEQDLDDADVGAALQQVGGEAVAQGVDGDVLGQPGRLAGRAAGGMEDRLVDRLLLVTPRNSQWRGLARRQ